MNCGMMLVRLRRKYVMYSILDDFIPKSFLGWNLKDFLTFWVVYFESPLRLRVVLKAASGDS